MTEQCNNRNNHYNNLEDVKTWLSFAQMDFESAKYLYKAPFYPKPLNIICYHCQQAAEKAVKALIIYFGSQGGMPKIHDISFLLNQIKNIVEEKTGIKVENDLLTIANSLSKYGVASRYPNEMEIDEKQTRKALEDSEMIFKWVENVIVVANQEKSDKSEQ